MVDLDNEPPQPEANGGDLPKEGTPQATEAPQANGGDLPAVESKLSPREHAIACGLIKRTGVVIFGATSVRELRLPEYRATAVLHGWEVHEQHSAEPFRLTREAFLSAVEAAKKADERGSYAPHAPALAPHLTKGDA